MNYATVKAVLSGDTVLLVGKSTGTTTANNNANTIIITTIITTTITIITITCITITNVITIIGNAPPQEISITLASIQAPRLARGSTQNTSEEPFAWEAREYLRRLCVGKQVAFNVISCVTAIGRTHGDVDFITNGNSNTVTSLALNVVSAGYATVKKSRDDKRSNVYDDLIDAENNAKEEKLGLFGDTSVAIKRVLNWAPTSAEVENIFKTLKNKPTKVIIESVRDGAALRVLLLPNSPFPFTYIPFSLAGVMSPRLNNQKTDVGGEPLQTEPFAVQSRHFTEIRLLNRDVEIVMQGLDRMGNILGTVLHPKGNVAIEILKEGLARVADKSLAFVTGATALEMRKAEASAKAMRKFIWENYTTFAPSIEDGARIFEGVCVEIVSGDTIVVGHPENPLLPETRVTVSSIRSFRNSRDQKDAPTPTEEAWGHAAKESLRNKVLGRKVYVYIEYEKSQGKTGTSNRSYGTIIYARGPQGNSKYLYQ